MTSMVEHQEYIQQKLNPILENLVTQTLLERPDHLPSFMIQWLEKHSKSPAGAALSSNDLSCMKSELEQLQAEVRQLESEVGDKTGGDINKNKKDAADDSEDEEEDGDVADLPPAPPISYNRSVPRASVSAEAHGKFNPKIAFTPPSHPKTENQEFRIKDVLMKSFLFRSLEQKELGIIVGAMLEKPCEKGTTIIKQGDDGDCLFVVESGTVNVYKTTDGAEKFLRVCKAGDAFGELALLYNCPRTASVIAADEEAVLWKLDRETFNHIVRDAAQKRRDRHEDFLKDVPILEGTESYERLQMCDALQIESFLAGTKILQQGDSGDKFFLLEEGEAVATKVSTPGSPAQEVFNYKSGDYFGELALLNSATRAATVTAKTDCQVLSLTGDVFKSLLGPLEDILRRKSTEYK